MVVWKENKEIEFTKGDLKIFELEKLIRTRKILVDIDNVLYNHSCEKDIDTKRIVINKALNKIDKQIMELVK